MSLDRRWQNQTPIDWIEIWIRIVWAVALPLVAGMTGVLTTQVGVIILIWQALIAASYLFGFPASRPAPLNAIQFLIETLLSVWLIRQSGGLTSPLWWSLLIGGVSGSLSIQLWVLPWLLGFAALIAGLDGWIQRDSPLLELNLVGFYVSLMVLFSWVLSALAKQLRNKDAALRMSFEAQIRTAILREWDKAEAAVQGSTTILSDLDLQRVYQKTLATTTQSLLSGEQDDPRLQAGLFSS